MNHTSSRRSRKSITAACIIMGIAYVFQFVIFPFCWPRFFPNSNEAAWMYWGTLFLAILFGGMFVSGNIFVWIIPDVVFRVLIHFYNCNGAYGFEEYNKLRHIFLYNAINLTALIVFQSIVLGVIYLIRKIKKLLSK